MLTPRPHTMFAVSLSPLPISILPYSTALVGLLPSSRVGRVLGSFLHFSACSGAVHVTFSLTIDWSMTSSLPACNDSHHVNRWHSPSTAQTSRSSSSPCEERPTSYLDETEAGLAATQASSGKHHTRREDHPVSPAKGGGTRGGRSS